MCNLLPALSVPDGTFRKRREYLRLHTHASQGSYKPKRLLYLYQIRHGSVKQNLAYLHTGLIFYAFLLIRALHIAG